MDFLWSSLCWRAAERRGAGYPNRLARPPALPGTSGARSLVDHIGVQIEHLGAVEALDEKPPRPRQSKTITSCRRADSRLIVTSSRSTTSASPERSVRLRRALGAGQPEPFVVSSHGPPR